MSLPLWPLLLLSKRRLYRGAWERLGRYPISTTAAMQGARPIWIHAASVGEVKSAVVLVEAIRACLPHQKILMSTMTATGRQVAVDSARADGVIYFPLDLPWVVARTLQQFDPALLVVLETEVWPNTIHRAHRSGVPVVLLSGRLSGRSERRFHRFGTLFERVLREVSAFGMQDERGVARLLRLGVEPSRIFVTGSLKQASASFPPAPAGLERVTGYQSRPVVVTGSTHRGEEEIFVDVLLSLRRKFPNILLIIAPRHPERFAEVEALLRRMDVRYRKRSEIGPIDLSGYEALLVDSVGELAWLYEWATVVFLGGTLANVGGHNLIEPGKFGKPILIGPNRANVAAMADAMLDAGAAVEVRTKDDVLGRLEYLFEHREIAAAMGRRGRAIAAEDRGVVSKTMRVLNDVLQHSSAGR